MARTLHKLTDVACKSTTKAGLLGDGGGLYLSIQPTGSKSWAFIWRKGSKRHEMGLGPYPTISLAAARKRASDCRQIVADGGNPIRDRRRDTEPTFGDCADTFLAGMERQWRNEKHRAQWRMTLERYAAPIRGLKVSQIETEDVLRVLTPLWDTKPETASRLRGRIERVLDFAESRGWRTGKNPAAWRGHLRNVLPARQKLTRGHHAAMPYANVPAFLADLRGRESMAARALEFLILTAARSGEGRGAHWTEIDLPAAVWTIPAQRTKMAREHRVPLSSRAVEILHRLNELRTGELVFPGQRPGRPLSDMAFAKLMERMGVQSYTAHGFRSSFRDWAGDATNFPRELAEQALAHRVGDMTELAYRRNDALERRRQLMEAWADYCSNGTAAKALRLVVA